MPVCASADHNAGRYRTGVPAPHGGYIYRDAPVAYGRGGYYRGSAAADGLWLGALAGGIVGHNHGGDWRHNGGRGAAWGAGAGWLLGSLIDSNRNYYGGYDYGYSYGYPRTVMTALLAYGYRSRRPIILARQWSVAEKAGNCSRAFTPAPRHVPW